MLQLTVHLLEEGQFKSAQPEGFAKHKYHVLSLTFWQFFVRIARASVIRLWSFKWRTSKLYSCNERIQFTNLLFLFFCIHPFYRENHRFWPKPSYINIWMKLQKRPNERKTLKLVIIIHGFASDNLILKNAICRGPAS